MRITKNILLLTAEAGGGHKSVSLALKERFEKALPGHRLTVVNAYDELLDFPLSLINNAHRQIVRHSPALWNLLFESTSMGNRFSAIESMTRPLTRDKVEQLLDRTAPSAILSVVPLVNSLVGRIAADRGIPFVVVVTDMARVHPAWLSGHASLYCAPTLLVCEELVRMGVPQEKIELTGLPTRRTFFALEDDRETLRYKLGMGLDSFSVLMMGGGEGVGLCRKSLRELTALSGVEVYIFTGRNAKLKKRLERQFGSAIKVLGFVDNVAEWLKAADLLITKSGPSTLVEAAASRVPTLFMGALPGQEQSIIDGLLLASSAGDRLLCSSRDIAEKVRELMHSIEKREELTNSIINFASPTASQHVCSLVEDLIKEEDGRFSYV